MLSYELFKDAIKESLMDYLTLPENFGNCKPVITRQTKVNQEYDAIALVPEDKGSNEKLFVSPSINILTSYEDYTKDGDFTKVCRRLADLFEHHLKAANNIGASLDLTTMLENIVPQLIDAKNTELLEKMPHRLVFDDKLAVVYRWIVDMGEADGTMKSSLVTKTMFESLGLSEAELYEVAMKNNERLLPGTIESMNDVLKRLGGIADEIVDELYPMYIVSNAREFNGAISILYKNALTHLAEELKGDFYILPSSIHEVICVPVAAGDAEMFIDMVQEVNGTEVLPEERLCDTAFMYHSETGEITVAE